MKMNKTLAILFIITLITSFAAVFADTYVGWVSYYDLELPALKGEYTTPRQDKSESGLQYYYYAGNTNNCTGNDNGIKARVKSYIQSNASSYVTMTTQNHTYSLPNETVATSLGSYNMKQRNNTLSTCTSGSFGVWYLHASLVP